jgi:inosose dehydratase
VTEPAPGNRRLRLGSCPDSWGVWYDDDPRQIPWHRFLDELAQVGYEWLELGPYGYLPTDAAQLQDELDRRGLRVAAGSMHGLSGLHRPDELPAITAKTRKVAALTAALGAEHLVFVPVPGYRDDTTGAYLAPAQLSPDEWRTMTRSVDELGRVVWEEHGVHLQFHPHADSHVETQVQIERFLADTDPRYVNLCLDTGHVAYRRGDSVALIRDHPDRVRYVHIKQMDPEVVAKAEAEDLAFGQAVALGASCEPPRGLPDLPSVIEALGKLSAEIFVVVEQDMYPVDFDVPLPIAARTREYLLAAGIGG